MKKLRCQWSLAAAENSSNGPFHGPQNYVAYEKAQKMGLFCSFSLYIADAFPYHEVANPRLEPALEIGARFKSATGESQRSNMADTRMTQSQLIKELAETTGVGNKVAKQFLESFAEVAVRETKKKGVFVLPGIGRLVRVDRKARIGRNPATGESIKIPAKKVVKFRVAKAVKDSIVPPKAAKK
jgi:DNA-binding protein HU-beta